MRVASTSVAGALISSTARLAGGVAGDQPAECVPGLAQAGRTGGACYLIPVIPAAGCEGRDLIVLVVARRRGRTRESPHVLVFRVINEAARNLDSRPSPRTDHVEACRPLGFVLLDRS